MGTFIIILLIVIVIIGIKFFGDYSGQANEIANSGGMKVRYKALVAHILNSEHRMQIQKVGNDFIILGFSSLGGTNIFHLHETFGDLRIKFISKNPIASFDFVEEFPIDMDQNEMYKKLAYKINTTEQKLLSNL